jgi:hypothetical protein
VPLTVSIRFLTGHAHLHPWNAHHSDGRVEWPPSHWRFLRALVAAAGQGLTTLPTPYAPVLDELADEEDQIPLVRIAALLAVLSSPPEIWLPTTGGGHTRQFLPIHEGDTTKNSGSAVFDSFVTLSKNVPICFHWAGVSLSPSSLEDLRSVLKRLTYFGRAESWCDACATDAPPPVTANHTHWRCVCVEGQDKPLDWQGSDRTLERMLAPSWPLLPASVPGTLAHDAIDVFSEIRRPAQNESMVGLDSAANFKSFVAKWPERLELRAAPSPSAKRLKPWNLVARGDWTDEQLDLCVNASGLEKPDLKTLSNLLKKRVEITSAFDSWSKTLSADATESRIGLLLLRCLLRASGEDMKDGLQRPVGTRWVHYAVPRAIYQLPKRSPERVRRQEPNIDLIRFTLNTATVNRPVLPQLADTLLVADKLRAAALAWHNQVARDYPEDQRHPRNLCGREADDSIVQSNDHAFFWPTDEDDDGLIDHLSVFCPSGLMPVEVEALRRLLRIRQRGGRPDLLLTPVFLGCAEGFAPWTGKTTRFVSATPYFCPVHLGHGRSGGAVRSVTDQIRKSLLLTGAVKSVAELVRVEELLFSDNAPGESVLSGEPRYIRASLKAPDDPHPAGFSTGLFVDNGNRFIRALAFCRKRRHHVVNGNGRMFLLEFGTPRLTRPFSIGAQAHFGLGLFVPVV